MSCEEMQEEFNAAINFALDGADNAAINFALDGRMGRVFSFCSYGERGIGLQSFESFLSFRARLALLLLHECAYRLLMK